MKLMRKGLSLILVLLLCGADFALAIESLEDQAQLNLDFPQEIEMALPLNVATLTPVSSQQISAAELQRVRSGVGDWYVAGEIKDEDDFIEFLNLGGPTDPDVSYTIRKDMRIQADQLVEDDFYFFALISNLDGQGHTITIDVEEDALCRSPFYTINGRYYTGSGQYQNPKVPAKMITVENLNFQFNGDVNISPFVTGLLGSGHFRNIHINVDGDIVAGTMDGYNYRDTAYGFARGIGDINDGIRETNITNVTIKANTIGTTEKSTTDAIDSISGFSDNIGYGSNSDITTNLSDITVHYQEMYAEAREGGIQMSGFATRMMDPLTGSGLISTHEDLHVIVDGNMHAIAHQNTPKTLVGAGTVADGYGLFGLSGNCNRVNDSSVTVKGQMIYESNQEKNKDVDRVCIAGLMVSANYNRLQTNIAENNVINIGGLRGSGTGEVYVGSGIMSMGVVYADNENNMTASKNNVITVGEIKAHSLGLADSSFAFATGFGFSGSYRSENDQLIVKGDISAINENGTAYAIGYGMVNGLNRYRGTEYVGNSLHISGDVIAKANGEGNAYAAGFAYAFMKAHQGNTVIIDGDISATAEGSYAYASGYAIGIMQDASVLDSQVYLNGNLSAQNIKTGGGTANALGFVYSHEGTLAQSGVYVNGKIEAKGGGNSIASGFAVVVDAGGKLSDCAAHIAQSIIAEGANANAGGFAVSISGLLEKNALYAAEGTHMVINGVEDAAAENNFVLFAETNAVVASNTLFGLPGTDIGYPNFIYEVDPASQVNGNYYTAMLNGQRASNLLTYDALKETFFIDSADSPAISTVEVSAQSDFTTIAEYLVDARGEGNVGLTGPSGATLNLDGMLVATYQKSLAILRGSSGAALDLVGLGHIYPGNQIEGTVWENDSSGNPLGNVLVEVVYGGASVAAGRTGANGSYSIPVPLYCTTELDYTLKLHAINGYEVSKTSNENHFTAVTLDGGSGTVVRTLNYVDVHRANGILIRGAGAGNLIVTYDANATDVTGTVPVDSGRYSAGDTVSIMAKGTLARGGFTFAGWTLNRDGSGTVYQPNASYTMGNSNVTFYAKWEPVSSTTYRVSYHGNGHSSGSVPIDGTSYYPGQSVTIAGNTGNLAKSGYTFQGWTLNVPDTGTIYTVGSPYIMGNADATFYAKWTKDSDNGGGSGGNGLQVTFYLNDDTDRVYKRVSVNSGGKVAKPEDPEREGYFFEYWALDKAGNTEYDFHANVTRSLNLYAIWSPDPLALFADDHYAYLVGYQDGTIRPEAKISRAEAATIFFRLLSDETLGNNWRKTNTYTDVASNLWYNNAISTMSKAGILTGYPTGDFKPNRQITRAELVTILVRFSNATYSDSNLFEDINGHWAAESINAAANMGWIEGYGDGSFRPGQSVTRAETTAMVNRFLNRLPESTADLHPDMRTWPDNQDQTAWYYIYIQEASNSHDHERKENRKYEVWTKLRESPNWILLEGPESTPDAIQRT